MSEKLCGFGSFTYWYFLFFKTSNSIILVTTQNGVVGVDEYPAVVNAKGTGTFDIAHNYGGALNVAYLIINPTA